MKILKSSMIVKGKLLRMLDSYSATWLGLLKNMRNYEILTEESKISLTQGHKW